MTESIPDRSSLPLEQWPRWEDAVAAFERAWFEGRRPTLEDYLPADAAARHPLRTELIHTDLEFRIKAGLATRTEDYLMRYPDLAERPEAVRRLVLWEYELRQRREPTDPLAEFVGRFPEHRRALEALSQSLLQPVVSSGLPRRLGRYELQEEIGRGSFGVVYRAQDPVLHREVAVKVLTPVGVGASAREERLLREARAAARLEHPLLVPVYDTGRADGACYIVSRYVAGTTLRRYLAGGALPSQPAARLVATVADALGHAHDRGLIHRDLKPSNIVLDGDLQPHVVDFGLAKLDSSLSGGTQTGELVGTPAYMSPEQAKGEGHRVDGRADVYALGAILYEAITGAPPFRGSPQAVLRQVIDEEPRPPSELNEGIPRDLETICLKCLQKEPGCRYASAQELADDLRRFLSTEPIRARRVGPIGRAWRWCRRRPLPAGLAAALGLSLAIGLGAVLHQWREAEAQRQAADRYLAEAARQRLHTEAEFRRADEALDRLLADLEKEALRTRGVKRAVGALLAGPIRYYEGRAEPADETNEAYAQAVTDCLRLATLHRLAGSPEGRRRYRHQAVALAEELVRRAPEDPAMQQRLATALIELAQEHNEGRQYEAMRTIARAAQEVAPRVLPGPDGGRTAATYARLLEAIACQRLGRIEEARQGYTEVVQVWAEAVRTNPEARACREGLASALYLLGRLHSDQHDLAAAEPCLVRAAALWDEVFETSPDRWLAQLRQSPAPGSSAWRRPRCLELLGDIKVCQGDRTVAADCYRHALALRDTLEEEIDDDLDWPDLQGGLIGGRAVLLAKQEAVLTSLGRTEEAARARDSWLQLQRRFPAPASAAEDVAGVIGHRLYQAALAWHKMGRKAEAASVYTRAAEVLSQGLQRWPADAALRHRLAQTDYRLGWIAADDGDARQALARFEAAIAREEAVCRQTNQGGHWQALAGDWHGAAQMHRRLGDPVAARTALAKAVASLRAAMSCAPQQTAIREQLRRWEREQGEATAGGKDQ